MGGEPENQRSRKRRLETDKRDTEPLEDPKTTESPSIRMSYAKLKALQSFLQSYDLRKDETIVGRLTTCDVSLKVDSEGFPYWGSMISKQHLTIIRDATTNKVFIKDTSLNGTLINSERIKKGQLHELSLGDVISLTPPNEGTNCDLYLYCKRDDESMYSETLTKHYIMTGIHLGNGGFGQVVLARARSNNSLKFAIKDLHKTRSLNINRRACNQNDIENEVRTIAMLEHPNIVQLVDFLDTKDISYIVLEYAGGGELFQRIVDPRWDAKGLGQEIGRFYAYQLISAIQYLHSKGIAHRDVKPENILLLDKNDYTILKLTDFGLAKSKSASTMKTGCGTPIYQAPELLDEDRTPYRENVDIWSVGVVLFTAFTGYPPFSSEFEDMSLNEQIRKGRIIFLSHWNNIDEMDQAAIRRMLSVNPCRRPTAKELLSMDWMNTPEAKRAKLFVEDYKLKKVNLKTNFCKSALMHLESNYD